MIVVAADFQDQCADAVYGRLRDLGTDAVMIAATDLFAKPVLSYTIDAGTTHGFITVGHRKIALHEIRCALVSIRGPQAIPTTMSPRNQAYTACEIDAALHALWSSLGERLVNAAAFRVHETPSMVAVARAAADHGFVFPASTILTRRAAILAFYERCGQRALLISDSGNSARQLVEGREGRDVIEAAAPGGVLLQQVPCGSFLRAIVIGEHVLGAAGVEEGAARLSPVELTASLSERSRKFACSLGLDLAELLLHTSDGGDVRFYGYTEFFSFDSYDENLRGTVASALAMFLANFNRPCRDV